jgi:hypothetical protein
MKSEMRLIKRVEEFQAIDDYHLLPWRTRGIYVLYKQRRKLNNRGKPFKDFVYIGLARTCIRMRLQSHARRKYGDWTHYSFFEVHDNITDQEIEELEGIFRFTYRLDSKASGLNKQGGYKPLKILSKKRLQT